MSHHIEPPDAPHRRHQTSLARVTLDKVHYYNYYLGLVVQMIAQEQLTPIARSEGTLVRALLEANRHCN